MKKLLSAILATCLIFSIAVLPAHAESDEPALESNQQIVYLEDGGYVIITTEEAPVSRATSTKSGNKRADFYNDDAEKLWTAVVTGTFTYTGTSATCTKSTVSYTIYDDSWHKHTATASKSSNKAIGDFVFKKKILGLTIQTIERTVTLTCSATGTLS